MSKILVKDKDIAVPGESLAEGMDYLPGRGTYRDQEKIRAAMLGLVQTEGRAIKLIPLSGKYLPKRGDTIIGKVKEILMSGWMMDTNSAYHAMLGMKDATSEYIQKGADLTQYFTFGDYLVCKITNVTSQKLVDVTLRGPGLRKLIDGRIITVNTHKVPRIIGKKGSMVSMIKQATDCNIMVGQNGIIWLQGKEPEMEFLATDAIKKIEAEAHLSGLTDKIKKFLEKATGKTLNVATGE
ncbi:exosome complex protein Rrp4 [Candidatus Woesearchaeota archaeon]|nr:exosome complex protein Rrp4 [Candidatus Woesearchaeota archaeon]